METFSIARNLQLPIDAVTQTFAFLGRRGSGKSYGASKMAEEFLKLGAQIVVLDPVGTWWGLRTLANGKPGFSIPVFGGPHGDVPLEPTGGTIVADFVVDTGTSMIIDLSRFRKNDRKRFVVDFAEQLFHKQKDSPSALHVFIDESQNFVPQRIVRGDERLLGAVSDLTLMGRNYGIGVTLISQRPQKVNKDVLNQTECLFSFQMTGPHERKAIKEWIADKGIHDADETVITKLPTGTAIVWSPQWLGFYGKVKINKKRTADTSATPKAGQRQPKRKLAKVDLEAITKAMEDTIEAAKERDPEHLRKQLADAHKEIRRLANTLESQLPEVKEVEVPVVTEEQLHRFEHAIQRLYDMGDVVKGAIADLATALYETTGNKPATPESIRDLNKTKPRRRFPTPPRLKPLEREVRKEAERDRTQAVAANGIGSGPTKILAAIAALAPKELTRTQVSTLSGYSVKSSTFANYLSALRTGGYIEGGGRNVPIRLTTKGHDATVGVKQPITTDDLVSLWRPRVPGNGKVMLDILLDTHPKGLTRDELAEEAGHSSKSSTYANYLSFLVSNKLVEKRNGRYFASDTFFIVR